MDGVVDTGDYTLSQILIDSMTPVIDLSLVTKIIYSR